MRSISRILADNPNTVDTVRKALESIVVKSDWSRADVLTRLRAALRKKAKSVVSSWSQLAGKHDVEYGTLLRNLVVSSTSENADVIRVLVEFTADHVSDQQRPAHRSLLKEMRRPGHTGSSGKSLHRLICTDGPVSTDDLQPLISTSPIAWWAFLVAHQSGDNHTSGPRAARALADACHVVDALGQPIPDRARKLVLLWTNCNLPRFDLKYLDLLPRTWRRKILASSTAPASLLTPRAVGRLTRDPLSHEDTPESIRNREGRTRSAIDAVAHRDFQHDRLKVLADVAKDRTAWDKLQPLLDRAVFDHPQASPSPAPVVSRAHHAAAARLLKSLPLSDRTRRALSFLVATPSERARLPRLKAILLKLPHHDVVSALTTPKTNTDRQAIINALDKGQKSRDALLDTLDRLRRTNCSAVTALATAWFRATTTAQLVTTLTIDTRLLDDLAPTTYTARKLGRAMLKMTRADQSPSWTRTIAGLLGSLPGRWMRAIARELPSSLDKLLPLIITQLQSNKSTRKDVPALTVALFRNAHKHARKAFTARDRWGDFKVLCDLSSDNSRVFDRMLLDLGPKGTSVRPGRPYWQRLLNECRRNEVPAPSRLVRAIDRSGSREVVRSAATILPKQFFSVARQRLSLRDLLLLSFENPWVAARCDRHFSRRTLADQISWVQRRFSRLPFLATAYELALAISLRDARYLARLARQASVPESQRRRGRTFDDLYHTYRLPKKSGGNRTITVPDARLKQLQRRLLDRGFNHIRLHEAVHGFRRGHSIATNAAAHVGQEMVVNVDISKFFPSTKYRLIVTACQRVAGGKLSPRATMFLADLCSFRGALPTGAPTSPVIGNIVLTPVDRAVAKVCHRFNITYTRYADDLTFSGHGDTHRVIPFVDRCLADYGFKLEQKKINLFRRGRRQMVTGLVVNEKVNLPRRIRRRLRAAVDRRLRGNTPHWHDQPMSDQQLRGHLSILNMVDPAEARRHRRKLRKVGV
jgi:retron-type reverse transcriptase